MASPDKLSVTGRFLSRLEQLRVEIDASQNPDFRIWAELQTAREVLEDVRSADADDAHIRKCKRVIDELMALYDAKRARDKNE